MTADHVAKRVSDIYSQVTRSNYEVRERMKDYALKYLPIVKSEVLRFKMRVPAHIEFEELHGVAICGLMHAFERYNEAEAERFGAYVRKRVRGAILDELRHLDTMSRGIRKKARNYDKVVLEIEQREGRLATAEEIRKKLNLSPESFSELLEKLRPITFFSLDEVEPDSESTALAERLADSNTESVVDAVESKELFALIRERINQLPERERKILHMYYFKDFRLAEIAEVFKVSESRICQLHVQAVRALQAVFHADANNQKRKT